MAGLRLFHLMSVYLHCNTKDVLNIFNYVENDLQVTKKIERMKNYSPETKIKKKK